jgi:hypothetical protein
MSVDGTKRSALALVIGVGRYRLAGRIPRLPYAVADAEAVAKESSRRFSSMLEFAEALRAWSERDESVLASMTKSPPESKRLQGSSKLGTLSAVVGVLLLILWLAYLTFRR